MFVEKVRVRGRRGGGRMWNRRKENQRKCLFYTVDNFFFFFFFRERGRMSGRSFELGIDHGLAIFDH